MASSIPIPLLAAVKRHWLSVLVLALIAAVAAGGATALREASYTATASITIDTSAYARVVGLPGAEGILVALRTDEFFETVASASGADAGTVKAGLDSYATGQPADRITITFQGPDKTAAEKIVRAAGEAAMDKIDDLTSVERTRQERVKASAEEAIAAFETGATDMTPWESADSAYKLYALKNTAVQAEYALAIINGALKLEDGVSVSQSPVLRPIAINGIGGAVVGLVLGIGLAYLRERSNRTV